MLYAFQEGGTVLKINPEDHFVSRIITDGFIWGPLSGRLLQTTEGKLYGMDSGVIWYRATDFTGGIFEIDLETEKFNWLLDFNTKNGSNPENTTLIQLKGATSPVAVCTDAVVYLDSTGNATIQPEDVDGGTTGNGLTLTISKSDFTCADIGENEVVLTVTDNNGNTTACTAKVTVADSLAPVAVCVDMDVYLDDSGIVHIDPEAIAGGSFDACGIATVEAGVTTFNCSNIGENLVEIKVTDVHGNFSSCMVKVTVTDNKAPEIHCADYTEYYVLPGEDFYLVAGNESDATASDNCNLESILYELEGAETSGTSSLQGMEIKEGSHTFIWTAADASGNAVTCSNIIAIKKRPATLAYTIESDDEDGNIIIAALLTDDLTGEGIPGRALEIVVNNEKDTVMTGENGKAILELTLKSGRYPVLITFNGDKSYLDSSYSSEVVTSSEEIKMFTDLRVYPNPFIHNLNIEFVPVNSGKAVIGMFDSAGRLVEIIYSGQVEQGKFYNAEFIPRTQAGSHYYYRITVGGESMNGKVIYSK
jgi:hypothetical protein